MSTDFLRIASNELNFNLIIEEKAKQFRSSGWRWVVLCLCCTLVLGEYVNLDFPAFLSQQIMEDLDLTQTKYNLLYTLYSLPNVIMPLFGGILIDKMGIKVGLVLFMTIILIGSALNWFSTYMTAGAFGTMVAGRIIFGLGAENMGVVEMALYANWFLGKEITFACGLNLSISRVGSVLAAILFPYLYSQGNSLHLPALVGFMFLVLSFFMALGICLVETKADKQLKGLVQKKEAVDDSVSVKDIKSLNSSYWLICVACSLNYICMFPWQANAQAYLLINFGMTAEAAGFYISIPYLFSSIFTPFIGLFVDKFGRRCQILITTSSIMVIAHLMFMLVPTCPDGSCSPKILIVPFVLLGIFYSFVASTLWPCVAMVCEPRIISTAYGVIFSIQNIGLALGPYILGIIIQNTTGNHGYFGCSLFMVICGVICVVVQIILWKIDQRNGNMLNLSSAKAQEKAERMKNKEEEENKIIN